MGSAGEENVTCLRRACRLLVKTGRAENWAGRADANIAVSQPPAGDCVSTASGGTVLRNLKRAEVPRRLSLVEAAGDFRANRRSPQLDPCGLPTLMFGGMNRVEMFLTRIFPSGFKVSAWQSLPFPLAATATF